MRNRIGILCAMLLPLAFGVSAGAQAAGTVRSNTLTQSAGKTVVVPDAAIKADDDKTLTGDSPLNTKGMNNRKDVSAIGSPVQAGPRGLRIAVGTALSLQISQPVSSGTHRNGQMVDAVLLQPVRLSNGTLLARDTPVKATVLAAAPAGKIQSAGVLSLEVVRVGNVAVNTDVLEFTGQRGHADVADANPGKGTEAVVQAGAALQFKVLGAGDAWDSSNESASRTDHGATPKQ